MNVKFCGATREVTGSSHLITLDNGYTILLDCGLYQGNAPEWEDFNQTFNFDVAKLDVLILSHAHIDHTGRVPMLYKKGFRGEVYCTHATRDLCSIMLMDSGKIQEMDAQYSSKKKIEENELPLYTMEDARMVMELFIGCPYEHWVEIQSGLKVFFRDMGHILGSASVTLEIQEEGKEKVMFGFTGDIGRPKRPILRDPLPLPEVDYLICESTYGNRDHASAPEELEEFLKIIKQTCVENRGKLLIPAFSVGRTQEIVYMLDQLENEGLLPRLPIYVDSPLAVDATQIFSQHPECFDHELHEYMLTDPNPFGFRTLKYIRKVEESKALNEDKDPCIIISASGMMNAGRIKHHVANNIENPKNGILIVGYCAPNTPGGQLRNGATTLRLFGETKLVKAEIYMMDSFSAHGDRNEMFEVIKNQKESLKKLFLVHGNYEAQEEFKTFLQERGFGDIEIPTLHQTFQL